MLLRWLIVDGTHEIKPGMTAVTPVNPPREI